MSLIENSFYQNKCWFRDILNDVSHGKPFGMTNFQTEPHLPKSAI